MIHQLLAQIDAEGIIDGENLDRGSPHGGSADEYRPLPTEMSRPAMPSWIEQARELSCLGVDAGEIWPLMEITAEASVGEIAKSVSTPMLLGDDVFDLKRREDVGFGKAAIFAASGGALADFLLGDLVHPWDLAAIFSAAATFAPSSESARVHRLL